VCKNRTGAPGETFTIEKQPNAVLLAVFFSFFEKNAVDRMNRRWYDIVSRGV